MSGLRARVALLESERLAPADQDDEQQYRQGTVEQGRYRPGAEQGRVAGATGIAGASLTGLPRSGGGGAAAHARVEALENQVERLSELLLRTTTTAATAAAKRGAPQGKSGAAAGSPFRRVNSKAGESRGESRE